MSSVQTRRERESRGVGARGTASRRDARAGARAPETNPINGDASSEAARALTRPPLAPQQNSIGVVVSKRQLLVSAIKIFDLVAVAIAILVAAGLEKELVGLAVAATNSPLSEATRLSSLGAAFTSLGDLLRTKVSLKDIVLFSGFFLAWYRLYSGFGLYGQARVTRVGKGQVIAIGEAALLGVAVLWVITLVADMPTVTVMSLFFVWAVAGVLSILFRLAVDRSLRGTSGKSGHLVIIGTNSRAIALARRIEADTSLGYRLVGFVDERWSGEDEFRKTGYRVVSDFAGFQAFLKDQVVDEVVICTPVKSFYDWSCRILAQCEEQGIKVGFLSDLFTPTIGQTQIDHVGDRVVLSVATGRQTGLAALVKRGFDFLGSAALLVVLAPAMIAIALAIKLTSPGPVLFAQDRVGFNKRRFRLYKFRTMVPDAEQRLAELEHRNEVSGPVFKITLDPRITSIGKFLRKSSVDELPQLFNVLRGDMSLVGPRPLALRDYRGIKEDWHRRRLSVRPGITCLWQVQGRNSVPFERWMELDMEYIDKWSLLLDVKILLKTVPEVLKGSGV